MGSRTHRNPCRCHSMASWLFRRPVPQNRRRPGNCPDHASGWAEPLSGDAAVPLSIARHRVRGERRPPPSATTSPSARTRTSMGLGNCLSASGLIALSTASTFAGCRRSDTFRGVSRPGLGRRYTVCQSPDRTPPPRRSHGPVREQGPTEPGKGQDRSVSPWYGA